ncbi:MAG: serine/threonine protein kinase, partial [Flavisolibacter sp.]|nr:serine/threonine protein kinase [Flavisolibacter sp.]
MNKTMDIPGYTINEVLHEGVDTVVYRAVNNQNKKSVVIKSLKDGTQGTRKAARFSREFEILEKIDIEGVNKVREIVASGNIVMEDIGGIPLSNYARNTKIELKEFLVIAIKLSEILSRLHAKNIMHKNINPDNIIINPSTGEIRLIDFGLSARVSHEHATAGHPGALEGSLPYMSPEQTGRMNRTVDYRTDLYSLGITFYQLLANKLPFDSDDPMELVHCHITKKIPPISTRRSGIPQVICDIILKLTSKIAEERYQSAIGLKHDLEHCLRSLNETGTISYFTIGHH